LIRFNYPFLVWIHVLGMVTAWMFYFYEARFYKWLQFAGM